MTTYACWKSFSCYGNICITLPGTGLVQYPYWQSCSAVKIADKGTFMHCSVKRAMLPANCRSNGKNL